jgi:protoporphyrinogen oxidase
MGGRVLTNAETLAVQHDGSLVTGISYVHEGTLYEETFDYLVSTIPCTDLVRLMAPSAPEAVTTSNDSLRYKAIKLVFLDIKKESITKDHWVYIPDKDLRTHRLSEAKNFNPKNVPRGRTVLCCEITCFKDDEVWNMGREEATELAVSDLVTIGLVKREEILDSHVHNLEHAYPLYDLSYKPHVTAVLDYVDSFVNLKSTGRQGRFKYNNMDHSMEMGLAAAAEILEGRGAADHTAVATGSEYFG